jgi:hypothetical protein
MGFEPKVPETALDIENQAAVCFSPPHCRSLELDFGFEFQQEELSNGFRPAIILRPIDVAVGVFPCLD